MDEDVLDYLQRSFDQHRNLKLLTTVSEWVESAQEIKGGKVKEYEVIYIENSAANGKAQGTVLSTIKGFINSDDMTIPTIKKGSLPRGEYEDPEKHAKKGKQIAMQLQNKAADILADAKYDVEMLPIVPRIGNGHGRVYGKNPDYLIQNRVFDCYSPKKDTKPEKICTKINKKVTEQAVRIVLNISRLPKERLGDAKEVILRKTGEKGDLKGLQELIVIFEDESIEIWFVR